MNVQQVWWNIRRGLTMSGLDVAGVFGEESTLVRERLTTPFRTLQRDCMAMGADSPEFAEVVATASVLLRERSNPAHFGEWVPGLYTEWGELVPGTDRTCVADVVSYGLTGPDGKAGFLREAGLPENLTHKTLCTAALLALIEEAAGEFETGRTWHGAHLAENAEGIADELHMMKLAPDLQLAGVFKGKGRGKGKLRKFLEKFITPKNIDLTAAELWRAAAKSSLARRWRFEFIGESQLWIEGEGEKTFRRFENLAGIVKKEKRAVQSHGIANP